MCADYRSFGSPLLIKSGNSGLKVIAIFTESVPECFSDMPLALQEKFPPEHRFESGTRMRCIYDVVATESRVLADDLFLVDERLWYECVYVKFHHVISGDFDFISLPCITGRIRVVSPTFPFAPESFLPLSFSPRVVSPPGRFAHFPVHPWIISPTFPFAPESFRPLIKF